MMLFYGKPWRVAKKGEVFEVRVLVQHAGKVLTEADLTAGDFVRAMRQLLDLLDDDLRDFLPRANRAALVREVRRLVTPELLIAWADDFSEDALLYENLYNVPDLLFDRLTKRVAG
jgi:hypothetical protein